MLFLIPPANLKWTYAIGPVLSKEQKDVFHTYLMEKYCAADEGMNVRICYDGVLVIIWFFQLFNYAMDVLLIEAVIYFIMDILMVEYDKVHMHVIKMNSYD